MNEIRQLEEQTPRVESGAVRFGNDWTGTFIRGDNAFGYAIALKAVLTLPKESPQYQFYLDNLKSLLKLLESSNENKTL